MSESEIKGLKELDEALKAFPADFQRKVLRGALRASALPVRDEAVSMAPKKTGDLRKSIRVSTGKSRSGDTAGMLAAAIKAGGKGKKFGNVWYARLLEFGVKPHDIRPKNAKSLFIAGLMRDLVRHPGFPENRFSFFRPALRAKLHLAAPEFKKYVEDRLAKARGGRL